MKKKISYEALNRIVLSNSADFNQDEAEFPGCCGISIPCEFPTGYKEEFESEIENIKEDIADDGYFAVSTTSIVAAIKRAHLADFKKFLKPKTNLMMTLLEEEQKEAISVIREAAKGAPGKMTFKRMISQNTRNPIVFITFIGSDNIKDAIKKKKKK